MVGSGLLSFLAERLWDWVTQAPSLRLSADSQKPFHYPEGTFVFPLRIVFSAPRSEGNAVTDISYEVFGPSLLTVCKSLPRYWKVFRAHSSPGESRLRGVPRFARFVRGSLLAVPEIRFCSLNVWPNNNGVWLSRLPPALPQCTRDNTCIKGDTILIPAGSPVHRFVLLEKDALDGEARIKICARDCTGKVFRTDKIALEV